MASTLCWTIRSMPAMPMADGRAPMVVGIGQTSRAISATIGLLPGVDGERLEVTTAIRKMMVSTLGEQDREGDLVERLLPLGPLDEGDHLVEEALARLGGDPPDPVGHFLVPPVTARRSRRPRG